MKRDIPEYLADGRFELSNSSRLSRGRQVPQIEHGARIPPLRVRNDVRQPVDCGLGRGHPGQQGVSFGLEGVKAGLHAVVVAVFGGEVDQVGEIALPVLLWWPSRRRLSSSSSSFPLQVTISQKSL